MDTRLRIGSVSFLNATPLIYGLAGQPDIALSLGVPSVLLEALRSGALDVALLPVIDYQRMNGLRVLTVGGIGCDGPTLTVRIFSSIPIEQIATLACDTDSHTSVALARIILDKLYHVRPEFVSLRSAVDRPGVARLLIGDKVIAQQPADQPIQIDLGEAWKRFTGLPFVFAAWMARPDVPLGDLPQRLARAKEQGLAHVEQIIATESPRRDWPIDVARRYLTQHLKFDIGSRQLAAIELFHRLAAEQGIIAAPPRALDLV